MRVGLFAGGPEHRQADTVIPDVPGTVGSQPLRIRRHQPDDVTDSTNNNAAGAVRRNRDRNRLEQAGECGVGQIGHGNDCV